MSWQQPCKWTEVSCGVRFSPPPSPVAPFKVSTRLSWENIFLAAAAADVLSPRWKHDLLAALRVEQAVQQVQKSAPQGQGLTID